MPISVSSRHFALRYEVPKFLARGGHLCMAVLTIAATAGRRRPPPPLDLFFHDAIYRFHHEPAGDARARKQLADHAFCSWRAGGVLFVHERVAARR